MKIIGLDGKEYSWNIKKTNPRNKCSEYHRLARELIKNLFPTEVIVEEVHLPGTNGLKADFYLTNLKVLVEVHGEQHYTMSSFFHGSKKDFLMGQRRDKNKREWCENNNIIYIELPYKENIDEWRVRIIKGITGQ